MVDVKFPLGHDPSLYDISLLVPDPYKYSWPGDPDLYKRSMEKPWVNLTPPSEGYHQAVEDSRPSGVFTGPRSFLKTLGSMVEELPQAVYDSVDYPAAAIRGGGYFSSSPGEAPPDPSSDEGIQRSLDAAGTVTLGGGAIPRAAPNGSLRAGFGRSGPTQRYVTALRTPDGQIYAGGPTHGDVMSNMPPEAQKAFWDGYNPKNEGFVDKDGNFLDREQVFEIEYRAGRINDTLSGQPSMTSEDLDAPNWGGEEMFANRSKSSGAAPLAMDLESRMARASKMGFNIDSYHGSVIPDISEFYPKTHSGTPLAASDRVRTDEIRMLGSELRGVPENDIGVGESIYPLKLRGSYIDMDDLGDEWYHLDKPLSDSINYFRSSGPEIDNIISNPDLDMSKTLMEILQDNGYAGIKYENVYEDPGSTSYLTFDPKDIRSTSAKFDPDKSNSSDILSANRSTQAGAVPIFSRLEREAANLPQPKAQGQQWSATLKNKGVPQEEVEWTGVADWLKERGTLPVTKEELLAQIQQRQTQVGVKRFGVDPSHRSQTDDRPDLIGFLEDYTDLDPAEYLNLSTERLRSLAVQEGYDQMVDMTEAPTQVQPTKYTQYQLPGGENYREVLLTLPEEVGPFGQAAVEAHSRFSDELLRKYGPGIRNKATPEEIAKLNDLDERATRKRNSFNSSHWDEPNVLAHMRVNDRNITLPNTGEQVRTLFAEEIQSDWHQKGRREGYGPPSVEEFKFVSEKPWSGDENLYTFTAPDGNGYQQNARTREEAARLVAEQYGRNRERVPNAPFKKTWPDLVLKRLVADAIEGGYDAIAWTDGATQAARYDLSKQVETVRAFKNPSDGTFNLSVRTLQGQGQDLAQRIPAEKIEEYVGKDLAKKIIEEGGGEYSGLDLQVGGEGMKAFYDTELPRRAKKLFGKYGAQVEDSQIYRGDDKVRRGLGLSDEDVSRDMVNVHTLRITPELREAALSEGLPLYANRSKAAGAAAIAGEKPDITGWRVENIKEPHSLSTNRDIRLINPEGKVVSQRNPPIHLTDEEIIFQHLGYDPPKPKQKTKKLDTKRIEIREEPEGRVPDFDWDNRDLQDSARPTDATIMKDYGRGQGRVVRGFLDEAILPKSRGSGITKQGSPREGGGYYWEELTQGRGDFPPIKVRINKDGRVSLLDGNHRLALWREQGFTDIPAIIIDERKMVTGGRFASGGGVNVEVNGETYQGKRESWRGRPLSKNIDDRRMSQKDKVNSRTKADRLPNTLETLIAPSDDLYLTAPHGDEDEFRTDMMIRDGVPKDIEEIILRQGGDQFTSGLIEDDTPGRTDRLPTSMPADSYVIPADIVSGLGQGNTLAGAAILDTMFRTHKTATSKAEGGGVSTKGRVPVIVAGGEYVVPPEVVNSIGQGDVSKGHKNLDSFVKRNRLKLVKTLKSLPGPRVD